MLPTTNFLTQLILYVNSEYDTRFQGSRPKRILIKLGLALLWSIQSIGSFFTKKTIAIPYLEIMITQRCNLRCKHCSNLMQHFKSPKDIDAHNILNDLKKILDNVKQIYNLKILGGEPFLHKDLPMILEFAQKSKKVVKIEVATNGGIIPNDRLIAALKHKKIFVAVSPYGTKITKNWDNVIEILNENEIRNFLPPMDNWMDFGGFDSRNRSKEENTKIFNDCYKCVTLIDGEIFCCPRAGNGAGLGLVPKVKGEYVNVRDNDTSGIKKELHDFSRLSVISTCDYCDNPGPEIPMAEQIIKGEL